MFVHTSVVIRSNDAMVVCLIFDDWCQVFYLEIGCVQEVCAVCYFRFHDRTGPAPWVATSSVFDQDAIEH